MRNPERIVFDPDRRSIGICTGKVELGQHVHEAFRLIVSRAFGIAAGHVHVCPVSTASSPDDGLTVGSQSVQVTGRALEAEARALAARLLADAAELMQVPAEGTVLDPETLVYACGAARCDLFDLVALRYPEMICSVGAEPPLIRAAITGERIYLQDMSLPGMVHARALRGRDAGAVAAHLPEGSHLIEDRGFGAVWSPDEAALHKVWAGLPQAGGAGGQAFDGPIDGWIKGCHLGTSTVGEVPRGKPTAKVTAIRPFLLHGSVAPSCAIARLAGGTLTVWTHSQGIFPLRDQIARALGLATDKVELRHVGSAGAYGHNAADDAAMDAAMVAMQVPGRPVRVAWPREDEIRHGPVGAPMLVEASAILDERNTITGWHQEIWSGPHGQRPGSAGCVNLLAAIERDPSLRATKFDDLPPQAGAGAARNGVPIYAIPEIAVTTHITQDLPVRSSSLRGLGAQMNIVAIEALMDRLARDLGEDPIAFRARHLQDPRALAVLAALRRIVPDALQPDEGVAIALGRYKNTAAYAAVAARTRLDDAPKVLDLWAVVDAGRVISQSGARNQIEGGMIQAASWTLTEGLWLRDGQVDASGWSDYPTLGWGDVPNLHVEFVRPEADLPPLGVGECMVGPTSAALVNAINSQIGQTVADLPLDRDKLISTLNG